MKGKMIATREAYGKALAEIGSDERVVVVDADLSTSTKTVEFAKRYPERFVNVGVAEQNLIGVAAGLALAGKIVFASTYAVFSLRAAEQMRVLSHDNLNVRVAVTHAGLTNGVDGWSHHTIEDISFYRALPNFKVVAPADAVETERVIRASLDVEGPWYIRLSRAPSPVIFDESYEFRLGRAVILEEGDDVTIASYGMMLSKALEAANKLRELGVRATVVNYSTIKPLDGELTLKLAQRTGAFVVFEEHNVYGGLGGALAEFLSQTRPTPMRIVGVNDRWTPTGEPEEIYGVVGLTVDNVVRAVNEVLRAKGGK